MRLSHALKIAVRIEVVLTAALCLCAQEPNPPAKDAHPKEVTGIAPRLAPTDYQAHAQAGAVTIAADFVRHAVPTSEAALTTEDYVVVELGLYGPPESRMQISMDDFSLSINGKKPLRSQPFGMVLASLKDPEYVPPETAKPKSKTSLGGGDQEPGAPPPVVHIPIEVQRAMALRTQKASLPLGDRPLPQAGLLFFLYRGKANKLDSVDLIYSGSAGKATLALQP